MSNNEESKCGDQCEWETIGTADECVSWEVHQSFLLVCTVHMVFGLEHWDGCSCFEAPDETIPDEVYEDRYELRRYLAESTDRVHDLLEEFDEYIAHRAWWRRRALILMREARALSFARPVAMPPPYSQADADLVRLVSAINRKNHKTVTTLLQNGADSFATYRGRTILEWAIKSGDESIVKLVRSYTDAGCGSGSGSSGSKK